MNLDKVNIRGVAVANVNMDEALAYLMESIEENRQTAVFTPNAEIIQLCIDDPSFAKTVNDAQLVVPDGVGVVKAARILKTPLKGKVAGVELGERLLSAAADNGYKVFLFGGKDASRVDSGVSVADQCKAVFEKKFDGIQIVGTRDGYCKKDGDENDETVRLINESGADILFVCLGAPLQEKWIAANRHRMPDVKILLGLGGSLDVYSGNVKRAPKLFIKLGLEWLYRLLCEPSRIGRMMSLPKFYFGTWRFMIKNSKKK